jgi:hypothetical protein
MLSTKADRSCEGAASWQLCAQQLSFAFSWHRIHTCCHGFYMMLHLLAMLNTACASCCAADNHASMQNTDLWQQHPTQYMQWLAPQPLRGQAAPPQLTPTAAQC